MKATLPPPSAKDIETLVGFRIGDTQCAVPIALVREILKEGHLTELPTSDASILGVSDVRGEVLLVLDPLKLLGLTRHQDPGKRKRWLVLRVDGRTVAWVVDGVTDVFSASRGESHEQSAVPIFNEWLSWVARREKELVFVLEMRSISRMVQRARTSLPPGGDF